MGVFENFPYTNFHDLNLDWILKSIVQQNTTISEFVTGNVLSYAEPIQWNITTQYAKNTVVIAEDGTAYMSIAPVPEGITLDNTDYWQPIFNFKSIITELESQIASNEGRKTNATKAYSKGALIWSIDKLYRALIDIPIGTSFIVGVNVEKITVERAIIDQISETLTRTAETITDTATGTATRTAENIIDSAEGDYTENVGHKTVEAEQITEHSAKDREIVVDGSNSVHVDGANTLNVGGAFTAAFADTFGLSAEKSALLKFKELLNIEAPKAVFNSDVNIKKDIIYKTPDELNDYFKTIEMTDQNGNKYNVLVATENTGNIAAMSYDHADIRNYGGVGDGETDDTEAFNKCMAENNLVYLPQGNGLKWVLSAVTITSNQSVIGDGFSNIVYYGSEDLFTITGSYNTFYGLNISTPNHGNIFHIKNSAASLYFYITDIVATGATHLIYDDGCAEQYTHLYVHNMTGHNMNGTSISITKGFAFLFLDNVTGANLPFHASWPTFSFNGTEGLHMTHCEAEGGGVDGTNSAAYGFQFQNCQAVWMERCMADLCDSDGIRLIGDSNAYFYLNNCTVSLCFGNGILLNGRHIFVNGCFINGRKGLDKYIAGANGFYIFGSDILVSACHAFAMTGIAIVLAGGERNNIGTCEASFSTGAILLAGKSGIIHDTYIIENDTNNVTDTTSAACKYYNIYDGSTMLTNIT